MQNVADSSQHTERMSRLGLLEHGSRDHSVLPLYKIWITKEQFTEFDFIWLNNLYDYVFLLYVYVWLPWLRFFRAFSSVVRQMAG